MGMRLPVFLKLFAILVYLAIIIPGQMIAIPFGWVLISWLINMGTMEQLYAIIAILGIGLSFANNTKHFKKWVLVCLGGLLMMIPLIYMMVVFPTSTIHSPGFMVPLVMFLVFYTASVIISLKHFERSE